MRLYYLSRRSGSSNWYVAFRDPISGMVGNKRSTGTSDRSLAESLAQTWLRDGFPDTPRPSSQSLADYLDAFWDYDRSPYVVESLAAGKRIHRRHANDMRNLIRRYFRPYFNTKTLRDIDETALRKFLLALKTERGLASATVNQVRNAAVVGLRFAKRDRMIPRFDFDLVLRCGGSQAERGILEPDEVKRLFEAPWRDPRSRLANRIAAGTGMRMGEIRALRVGDIGPDRLHVRHAWSQADGGLKLYS
jgi:integrase